ncbi:alpha/beta fold hydrolase [Caulobacter segnis]
MASPSWPFPGSHQIAALAAAGRWVIAPDQRGYGLTPGPEAVEAYNMDHLTGDLVGLLDHLGSEKAIFAGHDFAGRLRRLERCRCCIRDRVAGIIGLNTPLRRACRWTRSRCSATPLARTCTSCPLPEARRRRRQLGGIPKTIRFFMRLPKGALAEFEARPAGRAPAALQDTLASHDPATDQHQFLSPEELDVFVKAFQRTGFTGGINWYRNFTRNWEKAEDLLRGGSTASPA